MKFTPSMLTGKNRAHLVHLPCPFSDKHALQADACKAFQSLQQSAVRNGFNLQPASSFRDFARQQAIWNGKFAGERKVHDDQGNPLDLTALSDWEKCRAILRWSALPGGSRHHWGTEIDFFDPDLLPPNRQLQLEPWEYEQGGYFAELSEFLHENLPHFDFTLPFINMPADKKVGREPWHISYLPVAQQAAEQFSAEILFNAWHNEIVLAKEILMNYQTVIEMEYFV